MSVIIQTRGEVGGGVAAHLQCPLCGHFSKSHAHQLSHMAASHPTCLDGVAVGRLGNILMYQSTARLFHCCDCFFTSRDFTKLYKHIISKHCLDEREGGGGDDGEEKTGEERTGEDGEEKMGEEKTGEDGEEKTGEDGEEKMGEEKTGEDGEEKTGEERTGEDGEEKTGEERTGEDGDEKTGEERTSKDGDEKTGEDSKEKTGEEGTGQDGEKKGEKEAAKRKRSSEGEEEEEGEGHDEDGASQRPTSVKVEGDESVLMFDGAGYRCLICGWKTKLKGMGINHVVRKHDIPKTYAAQAIRRDAAAAAAANQTQGSGAAEEEEVVAGLSGDLLKEEMEATAKVVRFISNRFVCLICGWKTKLKGFAISHVVRSHDVERPYRCKDCNRSFFLPSRLQQHVSAAHRPGRYACPFCCFRSHFLGGFRRHCSRCNAREEEEEEGGGGGGAGGGGEGEEENNEEEEEGEERRARRKRRRTGPVIKEEEEEEEEEEDE